MSSNNINYAEAERCHLHANLNIDQNNDGSMGVDAPTLYSNISLYTMRMMSLMEQVNGSMEMRPDVQVSPYHTTSAWSLPNNTTPWMNPYAMPIQPSWSNWMSSAWLTRGGTTQPSTFAPTSTALLSTPLAYNCVTIVVVKERKHTDIGMTMTVEPLFGGQHVIRVATIEPDSIFSGTDLKEGMLLMNLNGNDCNVYGDVMKILYHERKLTIVAASTANTIVPTTQRNANTASAAYPSPMDVNNDTPASNSSNTTTTAYPSTMDVNNDTPISNSNNTTPDPSTMDVNNDTPASNSNNTTPTAYPSTMDVNNDTPISNSDDDGSIGVYYNNGNDYADDSDDDGNEDDDDGNDDDDDGNDSDNDT